MTDPLPSPASLLALLRTRRSVRRFRPDPVPEDALAALAEAAAAAPSAGNRQAWRLLLVTSRERIDAMAEAVRAEVARLRSELRADAGPAAGAYLDNFLHFAAAPLVVAPIHRAGPDLLAAAGAAPRAARRRDREPAPLRARARPRRVLDDRPARRRGGAGEDPGGPARLGALGARARRRARGGAGDAAAAGAGGARPPDVTAGPRPPRRAILPVHPETPCATCSSIASRN
jgi:nitroreductase